MGFEALAGNSTHLDRVGMFSPQDFPFLFPQKSVEFITSYNGNRSGKNKAAQDPFQTLLLIL